MPRQQVLTNAKRARPRRDSSAAAQEVAVTGDEPPATVDSDTHRMLASPQLSRSIVLDASPRSLRTLVDVTVEPFSLLTVAGVRVEIASSTQAAVRDAITTQLAGPTDDELSSEAAAKLLGVSRSTVTRLLDTGTIPCRVTAGGHRRVSRAELAGYLRIDLDRRQFQLGALDLSPTAIARHGRGASQSELQAREQRTPTVALPSELGIEPQVKFTETMMPRGRPIFVPDRLWRLPTHEAFARVDLPPSVHWSPPSSTFDLGDRRSRGLCYEVVLQEGMPADLLRYIDGHLLTDLWSELVLPRAVRAAWNDLMGEV
jgi:excisionase family DNA binding protein